MKIRVQKRKSHFGRYKSIAVTIPKEILQRASWFRNQRVVEIEVDVLGNVVIKP